MLKVMISDLVKATLKFQKHRKREFVISTVMRKIKIFKLGVFYYAVLLFFAERGGYF